MSLQEKIEKIRQKPEHVRFRYAWALTALSMLFILLVWALSLKNHTLQKKDGTLTEQEKAVMEEFTVQKESFEDATDDLKDAFDMSSQINQNLSE